MSFPVCRLRHMKACRNIQKHSYFPKVKFELFFLRLSRIRTRLMPLDSLRHWTSYTKQFNKSKTVLEKHALVRNVFLIQELKVLLTLCNYFRIYLSLRRWRNKKGKKGGETVKSCLAGAHFRKQWAVQEKKHVIGYCCSLLSRPQKQNRRTYWL